MFRELGDGHGISGALNGLAIRRREGGDVDGADELLRECLELEATRASPFHRAAALHSLGDCRLHAGDLSGASALYRESLLLARGIGSAWGTQACLAGFAAIAARRDQRRAAATLWGAAERVEELLGVPMAPQDRVPYERVLEPVLTDARAASARAAGHELEVERAIEYALSSAT